MALTLRMDIWSDIACPWCYVGKRRLETALGRFDHADAVSIQWRSFELDPSAPKQLDEGVDYVERLARKYRAPRDQAQAMIDRMTEMGKVDGIAFGFDRIRPGNTFDAHRLVHLGAHAGIQDAVKERFLKGYLCEGEPIGDRDTLARLATDAGLEPDEVQGVLGSDRFEAEVRDDERTAAQIGIHGVPFFLLDRRLAVQGAQTADTMLAMLNRAWQDLTPDIELVEGTACGPDGC